LIAASAVLVLGAVAAVLLVVSGRDDARAEQSPPAEPVEARAAGSAAAGSAAAGSAGEAAAAGSAAAGSAVEAAAAPEVPAHAGSAAAGSAAAAAGSAAGAAAAAPPDGPCSFDVTTIPAGAEILNDKSEPLGTTPAKLSFACGVELKLTFRRPRYVTTERKYTPTAAGKPLKVALVRPTVSLKVSSSPSGATVTVGGKSQGVTPTTIRLPANEAATLVFSKEGYTSETQRITAKQNNQAVSATLKRAPRKIPR
jgi:hypothetical protein